MVIGSGFEVGVSNGPEQELEFDFGSIVLFGHEGNGGGDVATGTVAYDGEVFAIDIDFCAVSGDPFGGGVGFVDGDRVFNFRRAGVFDEDADGAGVDHEVAYEAFVGEEVAEHPTTAVEEHECWQGTGLTGWAYDVEFDREAVLLDGLFGDVDAGDVDLHGGLCAGEYGARVCWAELFYWFAVAAV